MSQRWRDFSTVPSFLLVMDYFPEYDMPSVLWEYCHVRQGVLANGKLEEMLLCETKVPSAG